MLKWNICIDGTPVSQARPRFARVGKGVTTYDIEAVRDYKSYCKTIIASKKPPELATGALKVNIDIFVQKSKSWSKKRTYASTKPDIDNFVKLILDCMESLVYKNDSQIVELLVKKKLSDNPRVIIYVEEME